MIEYRGYTIRTRPIAGLLSWMAVIGWVGCIFAWKAVYGCSETDLIDKAKKMIDKEESR